jgi:hypothetical protein
MRRRRLIALITVGAVLILSLSAELIVRSTLAAKVSEIAAKALHATNVDTGIGATPALADVVSGRIATVSLHTTTASLCRLTNVDISVTLHDVSPFATPPAAATPMPPCCSPPKRWPASSPPPPSNPTRRPASSGSASAPAASSTPPSGPSSTGTSSA